MIDAEELRKLFLFSNEFRGFSSGIEVTPGLSGWAQINGRDTVEIEDKAWFDGYYTQNIGILMDLKCFFGTVVNVLSRSGVFEGGTGEIERQIAATREHDGEVEIMESKNVRQNEEVC